MSNLKGIGFIPIILILAGAVGSTFYVISRGGISAGGIFGGATDIYNRFSKWIGSIPWGDIYDYVAGGTWGLMKWIGDGIVGVILEPLLRLVIPNITLPWYLGTIVFFLILSLFAWKMLGMLFTVGYDFAKWALILAFIAFVSVIMVSSFVAVR